MEDSSMITKKALVWVGLICVLFGAGQLNAQVPQLINYQGKLDSAGTPLDGTRNLTFKIYKVATGGTALWSELQNNVQITNGIFSVLLGSAAAFATATEPLFTGIGERYIGITVGTGTEMEPRFRITSVAYSLRAAQADGVADGAITSAKLSNNSVTSAKIVDEPGISNSEYTGFYTLTAALTSYVIDSVDINLPASGYVEVSCGAWVNISHTTGNTTEIWLVPGKVRGNAEVTNGTGVIRIPSAVGTTSSWGWSIYTTRLYSETAGNFRYYLHARYQSGVGNQAVGYPFIRAVYYPTLYGTLNKAIPKADHQSTLPD